MKKLLLQSLLIMLMSMFGAKALAYDIAIKNSDGVIIYYVWANTEKTELAVSYYSYSSYYGTYSNYYSGNVVVPESVVYEGNTYSVTSIGESAFRQCNDLTSVIIPESVTSIGKYAFYYSKDLNSVTIPNSVTSIGENAFQGCSGLCSVDIPKSVTSINSCLSSVTIPNSVTSIGDNAFYNCSGLCSVVIGSGVLSIGGKAFSNTNLKKTIWLTNTPPTGYKNAEGIVNYVSNDQYSLSNQVIYQSLSSFFDVNGIRYVPVSLSERTCDAIDCVYDETATNTNIASTVSYKGITMTVKNLQPYVAYSNKYIENLNVDYEGELANYAFANCSNLKSAKLGSKITSIGKYAFSGCKSLLSLCIPYLVNVINNYTFQNCESLAAITIHNGINKVDNYAFDGCKGLKKVIITDREKEITLGSNGNNPLFASCPLDTVYIGGDINYQTSSNYGYSPFYRNTSLRAVKITDKETEISANEFYGCTNLQRVIIGDGVTTIGDWAFSGCQSLKHFAFGSQVANIGKEAFSDCTAVGEIISKATTPPICGSQALDDIYKWECKLYVPKGTLSVYQKADQWKDFLFFEETTETEEQNTQDPESGKCAKPSITYNNGKITFSCKTKGVKFVSEVTTKDAKKYNECKITISNIFRVSVYAIKNGYENSETVTMEIVGTGGKLGDLTGDGEVNVADHVELTEIIMGQANAGDNE